LCVVRRARFRLDAMQDNLSSHVETEVPAIPAAPRGGDSLLGYTLNGRFKLTERIARGGMGKVFKAEQEPLGRVCAVKVLSPVYEGSRNLEFHRRFHLEAATAGKLTHPNTVILFDYGKDEEAELYYIAMEYVAGRTLHRVMQQDGILGERRALHIAAQICRSVSEAHRLGVVHRDLKPGNVMLVDRGDELDSVKVLDFGLAKAMDGCDDLTQTGVFLGSPKYMAPEQVLGGDITPRTDIYALGVMLYEMLAGRAPFDRHRSIRTLIAHINDTPAPLRAYDPDLPVSPAMEAVVARCLEKDPAHRFGSMQELLGELKRVASAREEQENAPLSLSRARSTPPPPPPPPAFAEVEGVGSLSIDVDLAELVAGSFSIDVDLADLAVGPSWSGHFPPQAHPSTPMPLGLTYPVVRARTMPLPSTRMNVGVPVTENSV
jgi:eukaryotic-like serine/threonine-protein kinase